MEEYMKQVCAVLALVVALSACVDAPTAPRFLLGTAPSLAASSATTSQRLDNSHSGFVPCANGGAGENIQLTGVLHVTQHTTTSSSGKMVLHLTFNPQGTTGVGLVTGDTYRSTGVTGLIVHFRDGQPVSNTYVNNFLLIGPGRGNNLRVKELIHVASNANGELVSEVVQIDIGCA
jgi:hypothetical protein